MMSNLGDPARLRSGAPEGMQHLAVSPSATAQGDFGNGLYATHHQIHHNSQFLYGNGDLATLQSSQYPATDLFDHSDLHWQPQHQPQPLQHHQQSVQLQLQQQQQQQQHQNQPMLQHLQHHPLASQNFQPQQQQFDQAVTSLPEHHSYQQFGNQLDWQSTVRGASDSTTAIAFSAPHENINLPTRISSPFVNGAAPPSNDRVAAQSNTFPHIEQQQRQQQQQQDSQKAQHSNSQQLSDIPPTVTMLIGVPHVSVHDGSEFPDTLGGGQAIGHRGELVTPAPHSTLTNKKPRLSTPVSAPSPAATASPAPIAPPPAPASAPIPTPTPLPAVNNSNTATATKAAPKPVAPAPGPPPKSKTPADPVSRMKFLLTETLDDEEGDARELALKAWGFVSDINPEQTEMVANAVSSILKAADDETLVCMGKILQFTMRLRKWIVYEHNKEKKSLLIPKMLKLLSQIRLPLDMYDKQQWQKVLTNIHRKSELDKSREFANQILTRFQHLERERARTDRETKKAAGAAGTNNADKQKAAAPSGAMKKDASSSLNAGVKRPIEEVGKVLTASAAKKVLIGDVRNPMPNSNAPKSAAPSVPARNGPSSNGGEKKSATMSSVATSTISQSPTSTTATVSTKKPPSSSGFFKSLSKPAEAPTKAPEKKTPTPAPSSSTTSFTSIFAQLQQRQKEQDREKKDAASKGVDAGKSSDDDKKKKKSVKWRAGDDLVKVQIIEWVEPEGDYYGGGSGTAQWGDSVGEGEALRNRNFIEEEEDLMEWYQPKPIDLESLYRRIPKARENPEKRGGQVAVETEEAKVQKQRELVTLAAFYSSPRDIPASPMEPDESVTFPHDTPTEIPLPDQVKLCLGMPIAPAVTSPAAATTVPAAIPQTNDLSMMFSALQQQPQQVQVNPAQNIMASLQAYGQMQNPQQQQQQPMVAVGSQLDIASLISMINKQALPTQSQQQPNFLQNFLQPQPQAGQDPNAAVANILSQAGLLSQLTNGLNGGGPQAGYPTQGLYGPFPQQQQQQQQQQQPPTAPKAWSEGFSPQAGHVNQQDERNSARDVRRELRDAVGWSDNDTVENGVQQPQQQHQGGNGTGGGKWGKKSKKDKKKNRADDKNSFCLFYQKGNCKHGDGCRFSHDPSVGAGNTGATGAAAGNGNNSHSNSNSSGGGNGGGNNGGGGGGWKSKKRHGGHVSRGVDQGASASAVGWPGAGELEY